MHPTLGSIWLRHSELEAELIKCIEEKLSASEAADKLSLLAGEPLSRNGAIGKARRMGMGFNSVVPKREPRKPRKRSDRPRTNFGFTNHRPPSCPEFPPEAPKPPEYIGLPLLELGSRQCRYSHSDESPYLFCGAVTPDGSSWCRFHMSIVFGGFGNYRPQNVSRV